MYQEYARQIYPTLLSKAPLVMGIVNLSPDSFAEEQPLTTVEQAVDQAKQFLKDGADILDLGGQATNPLAEVVSATTELERVLPVVKVLAPLVKKAGKLLSVDSFRPQVIDQAIQAGATMINDVRALTEPGMMEVAAKHNVPVVLMHDQLQAKRENKDLKYNYHNLMIEILEFLHSRIKACEKQGLTNLIVDPGIGFSKRGELNLQVLQHLHSLGLLGKPILIGASNKQFIGTITHEKVASQRLNGSLAVAMWSRLQGATILRVHNVLATKQVLLMCESIWNEENHGRTNVKDQK